MTVELTGANIAIIREVLKKEMLHTSESTNSYKMLNEALQAINNI